MKLIIPLLATISSVLAQTQCDLSKLAPLAESANSVQCTADTGFTLMSAPSEAQLVKICASAACKSTLGSIVSLGLPDCSIGELNLKKDILDHIATGCGSTGPTLAPSTNTTTKPSATTAAAKNATTSAPTALPTNSTKTNTTTTKTTVAPSLSLDGSDEAEVHLGSGSADDSGSIDTVDHTITDMSKSADQKDEVVTKKPVPKKKSASTTVVASVCATIVSMAVAFAQ